jgi:hypothetical protein
VALFIRREQSQKPKGVTPPQQQQEFYVFYWQLDGMRNNNNKSGRVSTARSRCFPSGYNNIINDNFM